MEQANNQLVTIRVEDEHFGIPIMQVYEIIFVPRLTGIAKAPHAIVGVINLRGKIIPVIDLRLLFGKPVSEATKRQRIVVTQCQGKTIGLLVDEVTEVLRIQSSELEDAPDAIRTKFTGYIDSIYKMKDKIVILLRMDQLLDAGKMEVVHQELDT
jgi:purine-binding chemotaxis protein CheW